MDTAIRDIEFLARSAHRVAVLETLAESPRDRRDLCAATDASNPTVGRIIRDFEDRGWIVRDDGRYELTLLGEFVTERFAELWSGMSTARTLRDVWQWLPHEMDGFTVDLFEDAEVAAPGPEYPYRPIKRVTQLLESTDAIRGFGTTLYKSGNLEVFCQRVIDGMNTEYIYSPRILRAIVAWNPSLTAEALARENCTILLHDALPDDDRCGLNIMDDCIGICGHDPESAQLEAVIDTPAAEARAWADEVYEKQRREARPFDPEEFFEADPGYDRQLGVEPR
ncbi:helix-turn-helix transcriptional regulator [Natronorubrum halophilum]|uniref:helix-turn-helix transcriptional regulator n=1 Tax=Natronorubrum halophilum TaxID=1702106 RepID=UPI0010C1E0FB|nr:helix-turn-helix domain-containing protein [Natronorubrum halophilum]